MATTNEDGHILLTHSFTKNQIESFKSSHLFKSEKFMRYLIVLLLINLNIAYASNDNQSGGFTQNYSTSSTYNCNVRTLPIIPTGVTTTYTAQFGSDKTEFTIWRMPCDDGSNLPVITMRPITHKPFVCSFNFKVQQNNSEYDNILLIKNPNDKWSFVCGDISEVKTVFIDQLEGPYFNSDEAFTVVHKQSGHSAVITQVPAINNNTNLEISGEFSGSYLQSDRSGEGFVIQVSGNANNKKIIVYWFTYLEGNPFWLIGSTDISEGQTEVDVPFLELNGTGFGDDFDPSEINVNDWGSINLKWSACGQLIANYDSTVGFGSGTYTLHRITDGIHGLPCS
jgi:hypothetical protein